MGPLTLKPPHSVVTKSAPIKGTTDTKEVITVAPQKDICPQGSTYPKKAVPINKNKRARPDTQTSPA